MSVIASSTRPFRWSTTSAASEAARLSRGRLVEMQRNRLIRASGIAPNERELLSLRANGEVQGELLVDNRRGSLFERDCLCDVAGRRVCLRAMLLTEFSVPV